MSARSLVTRHSVPTFFALAFAISWASLVVLAGPDGIPATTQEAKELGGLVYVSMLLGPAVAGPLCVAMVGGKHGLRDFRVRLLKWHLSGRWFALALLILPALALATMLPLSLLWSDLRPEVLVTDDNKFAFPLIGVTVGLMVGFFEEIGWTGFAIPQLRQRHGILTTGLFVGVLWGIWHLPLFVLNSGDATGALDPSLMVPSTVFCLVVLPVVRVLMVWTYDRTESVLLSILLHASLTGGVALIIIPRTVAAVPLSVWYFAFAAATALLTATLMRHRSKNPDPANSEGDFDPRRREMTVRTASGRWSVDSSCCSGRGTRFAARVVNDGDVPATPPARPSRARSGSGIQHRCRRRAPHGRQGWCGGRVPDRHNHGPREAIGVVVLTNAGSLSGQGAVVPLGTALIGHMHAHPDKALLIHLAPDAEVWTDPCGWYAPDPGTVIDVLLRTLLDAGSEVVVRRNLLLLKPLTLAPGDAQGTVSTASVRPTRTPRTTWICP